MINSDCGYISYDSIGRFAMIPHTFIEESRGLSIHARWLFVILMFYRNTMTGNSFPSYQTIHEKFGLRRPMISKGIKELEAAGWLKRKKRFSQSTIYTLLLTAEDNSTLPADDFVPF